MIWHEQRGRPFLRTESSTPDMLSKRSSSTSLRPQGTGGRAQDWQTFRVDHIPPTATSVSLPKYFGEQDRPRIKVLSVVPSIGRKQDDYEDPRLTAVLSFAPKTGGVSFPRQIDEKVRTDTVRIDADFVGFTPLSFFPEPAVDMIFLPGFGNHPYDTWAENGMSNGECWPLDNLSKIVPKGRVLLYGYNPESYDDTESSIAHKAETFRRRFHRLRRGEGREDRPIVFVAHSTGCLVLKRILCDLIEEVEDDLVKCVVFLGPPHDGLDRRSVSAITNGELSGDLLRELSPGSPAILDLNCDFAPVADQLHIVACYETRETPIEQGWPDFIVPVDTATLFKSAVIPIDADHRGLASAQRREAGLFDEVVGSIKDAVNTVTKPAGWRAMSFSNGGPASPTISERLPEDDLLLSNVKTASLGNSLSPPKPAYLDRVHTASGGLQSKAMNFSTALRNRKKSIPAVLQRSYSSSEPSREVFALHQALRDHDFRTSHVLVERFTDFNLKDPQHDFRTVLHEAAIAGDAEVVRALLEAGAMSEPRTHTSFRTPLHYAAMHGHERIVKMLLDWGARSNTKSADESTPLNNAAANGHLTVVKVLVERGAAVNVLSDQHTPLDSARERGHRSVSEYLWSRGSRANPRKPSKAPEYPGLS